MNGIVCCDIVCEVNDSFNVFVNYECWFWGNFIVILESCRFFVGVDLFV